jgi:hypothetical protein
MKKNLRLILTGMSLLLLLGVTVAPSTFAATPADKNPQGTVVSATPKPANPGNDNSKGSEASPTPKPASPGDDNSKGSDATPTAKPVGSGGPAATPTPKPTNPAATPTQKPVGSGGPAATPTPKPTSAPTEENEEATSTPAPALPPLSYSFIPNTTSSMYVDGFGPVAVMSVQLATGQTVTIPIPPYAPNMIWGSFGTYANWAAQFQVQNGRAPTDQDQIDFWISQALAGQLRVSPTP